MAAIALAQGVAQAFLDAAAAPRLGCGRRMLVVFGCCRQVGGHGYQALGGLVVAVEDHVLHGLQQLGVDVVIYLQHRRIHDGHVQSCADGVVEEHGVHSLAHAVVAAETEGEVAHAAAGLGRRQMLLDPLHGADEVDGVSLVLAQSRTHGENIYIEDDVLRREPDAREQLVGAGGNGYLALVGRGLAILVEGHHHHGSAQATQLAGFLEEILGAVLEADGVDDALALHVLQTGDDGGPVRRVDHHGGACHGGVAGEIAAKRLHLLPAVEHRIVHVDVDDGGSAFNLLACHGERLVVVLLGNLAGKLARACHVRPFAYVDEVLGLAVDEQSVQPCQPKAVVSLWQLSGLQAVERLADGADMTFVRSAAAARDVQQACLGHGAQVAGGVVGQLLVFAHLVGQSRIGVERQIDGDALRELFHEGAQLRHAEGAVQSEAEQARVVGNADEERLKRLSCQCAPTAVVDGSRHHHGHGLAPLLVQLLNGIERRLGV